MQVAVMNVVVPVVRRRMNWIGQRRRRWRRQHGRLILIAQFGFARLFADWCFRVGYRAAVRAAIR